MAESMTRPTAVETLCVLLRHVITWSQERPGQRLYIGTECYILAGPNEDQPDKKIDVKFHLVDTANDNTVGRKKRRPQFSFYPGARARRGDVLRNLATEVQALLQGLSNQQDCPGFGHVLELRPDDIEESARRSLPAEEEEEELRTAE